MRQKIEQMDNALIVFADDGSISFAFTPDAFSKEKTIRDKPPFAGIDLKLTTFRKEEIDEIIKIREKLMKKWKVK